MKIFVSGFLAGIIGFGLCYWFVAIPLKKENLTLTVQNKALAAESVAVDTFRVLKKFKDQ